MVTIAGCAKSIDCLPPVGDWSRPSALVAFEELAARHRSLTRAADELSLAASDDRRRGNLLEEMLGLQLFHRVRNTVTLTAVGAFYADRVQDTLSGLAAATQEAALFLGRGGLLRLGLPPPSAHAG